MKRLLVWTVVLGLIAAMNLTGCGKGEVDILKIRKLSSEASAAYETSDYAKSGDLYADALRAGSHSPTVAYNAACSYALAGDRANAMKYINKALMLGYRDPEWMDKDSDLDMLKQLPEWPGFLKRAHDNEQDYLARVNQEVFRLYTADQLDRQRDWSNLPADTGKAIYERDRKRIERVEQIAEAESLFVADDYFHAALILQHGKDSTEYEMAWRLASKAAGLDPQNTAAVWLSAAAEDRYLQSTGKPQVWGTQWTKASQDSEWTQQPYDTTAHTDAERLEKGVRTLEQQRQRTAKMNQ